MQNSKFQNGFTLIELLTVIVVLIAIGTVVVSILFSSLRGTNKTNALTVVRQNGNSAISQMSKMIRNARKLNYPVSCAPPPAPTPAPTLDYITFTSFDGGQTTFLCVPPTISSNGVSLLDTTAVTLVSCSFTCSQNNNSDFPTIGINFSLSQNTPTGTISVPEKSATITFQTSVVLRNLTR